MQILASMARLIGVFTGLVIGLYTLITLLLYLFQERLIYFPFGQLGTTPDSLGLAYEDVRLETADGVTLHGWFVPAANAERVLLFFHGNAGNLSHRLESIAQFHRIGLNVLIIDYRGYGQSEGRPDEEGTYRDAEAARQYLADERGYSAEQVIIFGRSLGGAVAAWLAQQQPEARALILESTFTSIPDVGAKQYPFIPVRRLARVQYDTLSRIDSIDMPLLVIHSRQDEVIPYDHSLTLFEQADEPKVFLEISGGHTDGFITSQVLYEAEIKKFIETYAGEG